MKVAFVTNLMAHYRVPCFMELVSQFRGKITFFLLSDHMKHRQFIITTEKHSLPVVYLKSISLPNRPDDDIHISNIFPVISGKYDIIVLSGWAEPTYLLLWLWGVLRGKKIIFWIESTLMDKKRGNFKDYIKKLLLKKVSGCIVPGMKSAEYCAYLGLPKNKIFIAPNAADKNFFSKMAKKLMPLKEDLRKEKKINNFTIFFAGRLVEKFKNLSIVIKASKILIQKGYTHTLLIGGDGPDRKYYENLAQKDHHIKFLGNLDRESLCEYYALADIFILPSISETWGFVLNEAMEFGLPLIVSDKVGAAPDLVIHGENGYIFSAGDSMGLAVYLKKIMSNEKLQKNMGQKSIQLIKKFSPEKWAKGVVKSIKYAQS